MNAQKKSRDVTLAASAQDQKWMQRAIALARLSEGHTRPNPPVGAVVVHNGHKLGEGRHQCAGGAHAEIEALDCCTGRARNATLYVTLEPCSTHGCTPPCTERILKENISRVVVGCLDPNTRHCGRGLHILSSHGIEVVQGVCEQDALDLIRPFAKQIVSGLPLVTVKLAMTLDGRIADRSHQARWITGEPARAEVQRMRRRADVVMVGAGTVCADNPSLLCRIRGCGKLIRVIVDASGRTPACSQVYTDEAACRTIVATTPRGTTRKAQAWSRHGAKIWSFTPNASGHVPLQRLLQRLGRAGYLHLLCEGGGTLAGGLNDARLIDEFCLFYAPAVLGDARAVSGFAGKGTLLASMPRLQRVGLKLFGDDVMIRMRRT